MTVIFSKKCELAIQAVLFLSVQSPGECFSAFEISEKLKIPKEFVSKVLQILTGSGIVGSKKGKAGGFYLGKKAQEVRLIDIVKVIDGFEVFENCVLGFPGCSPDSPCPVHNEWGALRDQAFRMLTEETLADLKTSIERKISTIKLITNVKTIK